MSGDIYVIADHDVLIANGVSDRRRIGNDGILEKNTVLNDSALSNLDTPEENTVFNGTLDHTAVGNQGVFHVGGFAVICRSRVTNLREDRSLFDTEERIEHLFVFDELHIVHLQSSARTAVRK